MSVIARPERQRSIAAPVGVSRLWQRTIDSYPESRTRYLQLVLVSVVTVVLFWQVYVVGGVSTLLLGHIGMSFSFFVAALGILMGLGAFGAISAGLLDRWGRANVVVIGLAGATLLTLLVLPMCTTKWSFTFALAGLLFVEGIVLVATPALVPDFSPQLGRGSAMALWTIGPACGSLLVTKVANLTLNTYHTWQSQYIICGIASAIVLAVALPALRELSPNLRDQLMVELEDRELIEARAAAGDVCHEGGASGYRRVVRRPRVVAIAFSIAIFLALYYTFVFLLPVAFGTVFGYTASRANGLGSWFWFANVVFLVLVGVLSDRINVRKPFMLVGAIGTAAMTIVLLQTFGDHATGDDSVAGRQRRGAARGWFPGTEGGSAAADVLAGADVVQLHLHESEAVTSTLGRKSLGFYNAQGRFTVEHGTLRSAHRVRADPPAARTRAGPPRKRGRWNNLSD